MVNKILAAFPDARVHSGYMRIRCPYHNNGQEKRPSMGILLEARGNVPAGFCHCFACGKVLTVQELLRDAGAEPLADIATYSQPQVTKVTLTTTPQPYKAELPFRLSSHLESRGITEKVQRKFKVYEKDGKVHMPVFNREGMLIYDNARSTQTKQYFVERGAQKTLWGIEEIDLSKPIAVCEGQIDAMSFWEANMQAVATLGADNIDVLKAISKCTTTILLAFDPDDAGRKATKRAAELLGKFRCKWLDLPEGVDVNQALQDIGDTEKFSKFIQTIARNIVQ